MTLVEVMLSVILAVGAGGVALIGMYYTMAHAEFLRQQQIAINAAQGTLEGLRATPFDSLLADPAYNGRRTQALSGIPNGLLAVQIRPSPLEATDPNLLVLHVAACWQHRGRAIGEANGPTPCADGTDADWWVDSLVKLSTEVGQGG